MLAAATWPFSRAMTDRKRQAKAPTPAERPSMMSMMLKALVNPISQRKERGYAR
jgi:hypothetical protein